MSSTQQFRLGLVINAFAGLGGSVALKGSDGAETAQRALALGAVPKAPQRVEHALAVIQEFAGKVHFVTGAGALGEDVLAKLGFSYEVIYTPQQTPTTAEDTRQLVKQIAAAGDIDLLLFAGGDGTARDVCAVYPEHHPVLGIPAGVKIHSGVYAISPTAAGKVARQLIEGQLTSVTQADVMDIDEDAFRQGTVRARRYGEMLVPAELRYVQAVKMGGKESDDMVLADIAADVVEAMDDETLYIMGSGSTVAAVMDELGLANTLLGVDLVMAGELIASDVTARELEQQVTAHQGPVKMIITVIGGQGHIFGRGNQQLSPAVIRAVGKDNIQIVATKAKLQALGQRPLLVDTGEPELDAELSGLMRVTTGYHDEVFIRVESA
ncbi:ATP-NAD kinase family protein [Pseudidiomarina sp.]|uniref:ATP-NAD kinase family protein n=1 Tax=Pseudidiomarina sp. TaxID=2081707 RepID=UPI003A986B52